MTSSKPYNSIRPRSWDNAPFVVGDLHGMYEIAARAVGVAEKEGRHVYFLGDYLDSFDRDVGDQLQTIMTVLKAVKEGRATALLGNHELSYFDERMRCSGYNTALSLALGKGIGDGASLKQDVKKHFKPYVWVEDFLLTHAGVSWSLLNWLGISLEEYLDTEEHWNYIGRFRGGANPVGAHYWCDWRYEFSPVDGVKQIVGHTRGAPDIFREVDGNYCIDCIPHARDSFKVAVIKDGQLREKVIQLYEGDDDELPTGSV